MIAKAVEPKLEISLSDPGMTMLHSAGFAGLHMTLQALAKRYPTLKSRQGNFKWTLTKNTISLNWKGNDYEALDWLFAESFQISNDGLISLTGLPSLSWESQLAIHMGIKNTFLQHNQFFKSAGDASKDLIIDNFKVAVEYKKVKSYAHQNYAEQLCQLEILNFKRIFHKLRIFILIEYTLLGILFLSDIKHGSNLQQKTVGITGWLYPGATVKHYAYNKETQFTETIERAIALLYAPVACFYFIAPKSYLHDTKTQYCLVIPEITDLKSYARLRQKLNNWNYQQFYASGYSDAGFRLLTQQATLHKGKAGMLFKTTLLKAMLSSPMACLETVTRRIKKVEKNSDSSTQDKDIAELEVLQSVLKQVTASEFSKYQKLLSVIEGKSKDEFAWKGKDSKDRIVIFTERLETMRFLEKNLAKDLSLKENAIATLDGSMSDVDLMRMIEDFGNEQSPVRLLIATDVASEGINLHYLSHRLIHFDIPWSLMALQQRNGRIDRYGQEQQPQIRYLLTRSTNSHMDEVERIIQVLLVKDEQAVKNIGDPSVFMGVFDVDEEIRITSQAIESGTSAEDFASSLEPKQPKDDDFDFFALLDEPVVETRQCEDGETRVGDENIAEMSSLFQDDFSYVKAALEEYKQEQDLQLSILEDELLIELTMPKELRDRYKRFPKEILPEKNEPLRLSADKKAIAHDLEEARRAEDSWSSLQYLWELHPIVTWLNDRGVTLFGRHQAPVITLGDKLAPTEVVFIMSGVIPNRQGQPLINKWLGVVFEKNKFVRVEEFTATRDRTNLGNEPIPNTNQPIDESLLKLRSQAVDEATKNILAADKEYNDRINPILSQQLDRLEQLRWEHNRQLELKFENINTITESKKQKEQNRIKRIFDDYYSWVEESTITEKVPYIKIVAVLSSSG